MHLLNNCIAVIDDEPSFRETMRYILKSEGFCVVVACNGKSGLELIQNKKPRIVLLDLILPDISGFEICTAVKNTPELAGIQIIILTARGQEKDREKALNMGADAYLTKPPDTDELINIIQKNFLTPS